MDDTTTTEATGHSPTPWTWGDEDYAIYDAGNAHVSIIEGDGLPLAADDANGRFIVDAVNSVDRLRETVAALVEAAKNARDYVAGLDHIKGAVKCVEQIDAALALAAASHADNDAAVDGGQITEATK